MEIRHCPVRCPPLDAGKVTRLGGAKSQDTEESIFDMEAYFASLAVDSRIAEGVVAYQLQGYLEEYTPDVQIGTPPTFLFDRV